MKSFYARLKDERKRLGYGQKEVAVIAGIGKTAQSNYESGARTPNADYFVLLAENGFDVGYILSGSRGSLAVAEDGAAYGGRRTAELVRLFEASSPAMQKAVIQLLKT